MCPSSSIAKPRRCACRSRPSRPACESCARTARRLRGVAELKLEILRLLFDEFCDRHLARRHRAWRRVQELRGGRRTAAAAARAVRRARSASRRDAGHAVGMAQLARGVQRSAFERCAALCGRSSARDRVLSVSAMAGARAARGGTGARARARHAHRPVWRLRGGHPPVGLGDLGRPDRLPPRRRDRRAARSRWRSRVRAGDFRRRIRWSWNRGTWRASSA